LLYGLVEDYALECSLAYGAETLCCVVAHAANIHGAIDALRTVATSLIYADNIVL
jgi:hypothetical protein